MVFSSYEFCMVFLPGVLIIYFMLAKTNNALLQRMFLLGASLFFYGYYNWTYLLIIIVSILVNYAVARGLESVRKHKIIFVFGVLFNIGLLGYFKYYDFFVANINAVFHSNFLIKNIVLPLGISFFTFQQLSFLISVYKKEEEIGSFIDYCTFVTFFPQLVAGPIVLYSEMIPQFRDPSRRTFHANNFCNGLFLFSLGLLKKAVIADTISFFVDNGFGNSQLGFAGAWLTALGYSLQIYFDFSGYSDMAIGLGKMFNIDIPMNFDAPYQSKSITEFWRRWHITLGRALSTYVYIPLGGNRKGIIRTCINLFITFLVSGLWHGASWTFVAWGAVYGLLMVIERVLAKYIERIPDVIRTTATFLLVNALWVLFRAETFSGAMSVYRGMLSFHNPNVPQVAELAKDIFLSGLPTVMSAAIYTAMIALLLSQVFFGKTSMDRNRCFVPDTKSALVTSLCILLSLICFSRGSVFIYFNF